MRSIRAMHWNNIHPDIVAGQKRVLDALEYDMHQDCADRVRHGSWLNNTLEAADENETILFLDIDAFPTRAEIIERAFASAEAGSIFGVAQNAAHIANNQFIYAGPSFLCVARRTWAALGKPSMEGGPNCDAGMALSMAAAEAGVALDLIYPSFVCAPRWHLPDDKGCFGIGTFYELGSVFHLFESRRSRAHREAFVSLAQDVVAQRPIDYLGLHARLNRLDLQFAHWLDLHRQRVRRASRTQAAKTP